MSTVQSIVDGTFTGDIQIGTLEMGKVGLAPFHKFDSLISIEVKADLGKSSKISLLGKSRPSRKTDLYHHRVFSKYSSSGKQDKSLVE